MTITAWRIVKPRWVQVAFSGEGARRFGGRWNSKGHAAVYLAGSISLATLELLVHLKDQEILEHYTLLPASFDEGLIESIEPAELPEGWRGQPPGRPSQEVGDRWIRESRSAVLRVPSVVVESEWNYLINPAHPDFRRILIGQPRPFRLDPRLSRPR